MKKSYIVLSLVAFLFVNGIRMLIQLSRYNTIDDSACNILYWYSSIGLISASMMAIFCFSLASNYLRKWDRALCKAPAVVQSAVPAMGIIFLFIVICLPLL